MSEPKATYTTADTVTDEQRAREVLRWMKFHVGPAPDDWKAFRFALYKDGELYSTTCFGDTEGQSWRAAPNLQTEAGAGMLLTFLLSQQKDVEFSTNHNGHPLVRIDADWASTADTWPTALLRAAYALCAKGEEGGGE